MSSFYRNIVFEGLSKLSSFPLRCTSDPRHFYISRMKFVKSPHASKGSPVRLQMPLTHPCSSYIVENFPLDKHIIGVTQDLQNKVFNWDLNYSSFCSKLIAQILSEPETKVDWAKSNDPFFSPTDSDPKRVIVEFSSPNIAKPFHFGHLRSTIIGNYIANINEVLGHSVIRINFLGDWGYQFGLLAAELKRRDIDIMSLVSIYDLNTLYVEANKRAITDESFVFQAKECFRRLEEGDESLMNQWKHIREVTVAELTKVYQRLGIEFDYYHGESMYNKKSVATIIELLESKGYLHHGELLSFNDDMGKKIPLCKSDGSSLYVLRDVGAVLDRAKKFEFDKMLYVVENGQSLHFQNLFRIINALNPDLNVEHIKFGRIHGMSSRKGNAVLLSDILNEAKQLAMELQDLSINTRLDSQEEKDHAADICGMTGVLRHDMSNKRQKDYPFRWEKAIRRKSDTFQYNHCRLNRLLSEQNIVQNTEDLLSDEYLVLNEQDAVSLIHHLARFDEVLKDSFDYLEPYILIKYMQSLCETISKAFRTLSVKNAESPDIARSRVLLFFAAKRTLKRGMKILGMQPLSKM